MNLLAEAIGMDNNVRVQVGLKPFDRLQIEPGVTHVRSIDVDSRAEVLHVAVSDEIRRAAVWSARSVPYTLSRNRFRFTGLVM